MIEFFNNSGVDVVFPEEEIIRGLITIANDYALDVEYLNIIFLTDDGLLEMNKGFLKHDYYTDIITFNYAESEAPVEGELYISIDRVKDNADSLGIDFITELIRVIFHGMLHIAGFEDDSDDLKATMRKEEDKYLNQISFHVKPV